MTRNWNTRRSASTFRQETISLIIAGSGVQSMPGTICLDCAHSLNCLPGRARVARDPGSRPRNWALGSPLSRTADDATPALRAVALRPGRQDHGSVAVELSAAALRRHVEKLEHATISIHGPPRDDQPHHCWFRCAIDARLTPGAICLDCTYSLNCLPGRARVARDPGSRPRNWALGSPYCLIAIDAAPALRAVALRPGRQDYGSVAVELSGFPTEIESVETFALAPTSPVTSFPRRREPSQASEKTGLAVTMRLRQLSRPPVAKDSLRLVWVP